jgi:hypothetical protein
MSGAAATNRSSVQSRVATFQAVREHLAGHSHLIRTSPVMFGRLAERNGAQMETSDEATLVSAERVARNQDTFRKANDGIEEAAARTELSPLPVLCECADPGCTEILRLPIQEYEEVRADARCFINAVGHDAYAGGWSEVIAEREGYLIVAKRGEAGEIAERLDSQEEEPE